MPFILATGIETHQIKEFPHSGTHPVPIADLQFLGIEIGGGVGLDLMVHEQFIAGQEDLPQDIALLAKMDPIGFHPQIIKTKGLGISIVPNDLIAQVVEPKDNVPGRNDRIGPMVGHDTLEQIHQTGFPTSHRRAKVPLSTSIPNSNQYHYPNSKHRYRPYPHLG